MCFDFFILLNPTSELQIHSPTCPQLSQLPSYHHFLSRFLFRYVRRSYNFPSPARIHHIRANLMGEIARGNCVFHHIGADLTVSPREDQIPPHRGRTSELTCCFSKMCVSAFAPLRSTWQTLKVVALTFACVFLLRLRQ